MKRTAAIIGPTPPFLSWTIALPCPYRDPDAKSATNAAFRELRSLRAISVGEVENRIVDGICLHPDASETEPALAIGFPVNEVYAAFGGREKASAACQSCPANIPISDSELFSGVEFSKGGCFGWLPFGDGDTQDSPGFMRLLECESSASTAESTSIVEQFEAVMRSTDQDFPFPKTSPWWYGVWSRKTFAAEHLLFLDHVCQKVQSSSIAWKRLARAVRISREQGLTLHVDLTPPGHSDGNFWTTEACCADCGFANPVNPCLSCGSTASPLRSRRMKVLGLRPYLKLVSIIGEPETIRIVKKLGESQK